MGRDGGEEGRKEGRGKVDSVCRGSVFNLKMRFLRRFTSLAAKSYSISFPGVFSQF